MNLVAVRQIRNRRLFPQDLKAIFAFELVSIFRLVFFITVSV
ncbi:hypothetical protein [Mesorhizobium sp. M0778]